MRYAKIKKCEAENGIGVGASLFVQGCHFHCQGCFNKETWDFEGGEEWTEEVEEEFMEKAPTNPKDINRFIEEIPEWTAKEHGKKYRLMYQVYTHPKYIEYGKKFFEGVEKRYTEYAKMLEPKLGVSYQVILPLIFIFVRASVHYAMFEDKYYLLSQMSIIKEAVKIFIQKTK